MLSCGKAWHPASVILIRLHKPEAPAKFLHWRFRLVCFTYGHRGRITDRLHSRPDHHAFQPEH
jgi:hypothetical protein